MNDDDRVIAISMALGRVISPLVGDEKMFTDIVTAHALALARYLAFCVNEGDLPESSVDEILDNVERATKRAFDHIKQMKTAREHVH